MDEDLLLEAIAGPYRLEREIGRGASARVYLAQDRRHDRQVAIKVLDPRLGMILGSERFRREIEITARLNHPHVLPLYDSGEIEGRLFFVMPYMGEGSLRSQLIRSGTLGTAETLRIAAEVLGALGYAHAQGFVHRDVKPENILLSTNQAVLSDFGIARLMAAAGETAWTSTGMVLGTPSYMSPEQIRGSLEIDGRSDLYNLGCVIYEMLAGRAPFVGNTIDQVLRQHLTAEAPPIRAFRPELSNAVEDFLARALCKTPESRFENAEAMAKALSTLPTAAVPKPVRSDASPFWRPLAWWLTALLGIAALAVFVAWLVSNGARTPVGSIARNDSLPSTDLKQAWKPTATHDSSMISQHVVPPTARRSVSLTATPPLQADVQFYRSIPGGRERLSADDLIAPTDRFSLDVVGSDSMYVYVLDEDRAGNLYVLFPLAQTELRNPLLPRVVYRLPGSREGKLLSWGVSSSNGDETVVVLALRRPQRALDEQLAQLPQASSAGFPQLSQAGVRALRGLATLVEEPTTATVPTPRVSELLAQVQKGRRDRDLWTWQIHLRNPSS